MSNDIAPMQSIQAKIQDRIKSEFVNLIPDEVWEQMVASVVNDFTRDPPPKDQYGRSTGAMSPIKAIIHKAIEDQVRAAVAEKLNLYTQPEWDERGQALINKAMRTLIEENFEALLLSVNGGMVSMMVNTAMQNLRNSLIIR